jgi:hypothetical protein
MFTPSPTGPRPVSAEQQAAPTHWAILELFGHQRIAGRISDQVIGGASFVRVDVPEVVRGDRTIQAHTRCFGGAAIYAVNWCDEQTATLHAVSIEHEPVSPYSVRSAINALPDDQRQRLLASSLPGSHHHAEQHDEQEDALWRDDDAGTGVRD